MSVLFFVLIAFAVAVVVAAFLKSMGRYDSIVEAILG